MPPRKPKPKKDSELLQRVHANLGIALDRTLQQIVDEKLPIPAALASAAGAFLKLHSVGDDLERDAQEEAQEAAAFNYVPRVSAAPDEYNATTAVASTEDWTSLSAFCAAHGLTEDDTVNVAKLARAAAAGLPEGDQQREKYLQIAREAGSK